jgi:predicted nucleic acid-binding protein
MIVVDTSVWIAHFRNEPSAAVTKLRAIANPDDIVVGDLILLECLQGARDEAHAARMEAALRVFQIENMLGDQAAGETARRTSTHAPARARAGQARERWLVVVARFRARRSDGARSRRRGRGFDPAPPRRLCGDPGR